MSMKSLAGAICVSLGMTAALAAQASSQNPTQPPAGTAASAQHQTVTVEGCLVREKDVPGREANPAERAGVMEDFILTNAKIVKGDHPSHDTAAATGTTGAARTGAEATGTSGVSTKMFEVRGLNESELQQFVGQRVEIEGKLDPSDVAERSREQANPAGEKSGDLPELMGATIKKSSSTEPCTPGAIKK
jgi:hypothetical protein